MWIPFIHKLVKDAVYGKENKGSTQVSKVESYKKRLTPDMLGGLGTESCYSDEEREEDFKELRYDK